MRQLCLTLDSKKLVAGLDVFHNEPGSNDHTVSSPLCAHPRVYGTHHIGASTNQATLSVGDAVIEIISHWNDHGQVQNCVNLARQSPADHTLTVRHVTDRVGVLASVLDELQAAGHNVQEMDNIIFQGGLSACARIQVVGAPSQELIAAIEQLSLMSTPFQCPFINIQGESCLKPTTEPTIFQQVQRSCQQL